MNNSKREATEKCMIDWKSNGKPLNRNVEYESFGSIESTDIFIVCIVCYLYEIGLFKEMRIYLEEFGIATASELKIVESV